MASKINVPESEEDGIDPFDRVEIAAIVQDLNQTDISSTTRLVKFMTGCRNSEAVGLQWKTSART